jgi:hypothetical protein
VKTAFEYIWELIRGDLPIADFERLAYGDAALEEHLGHELYLEVVSTDFRSGDATHKLKRKLAEFQRRRRPLACRCIELKNAAVVDMGEESDRVFRTLRQVAERGAPYWWLFLSRCEECGQHWLVAEESRQNDVFCMLRLEEGAAMRVVADGVWPPDLDKYETLLVAGKEAGKSVRFMDPLNSSSLAASMEQLAGESPGIKLSYLAELLNLDVEIARIIGSKVAAEQGVEIRLDE